MSWLKELSPGMQSVWAKILQCYMSADMLIYNMPLVLECLYLPTSHPLLLLFFLSFGVYITHWSYPCDASCSKVHHLHHPHTQPETHSSPHHSQELKKGEGGVKWFCNCYNLVKSQVKCCCSIFCILSRDSRSSYLKIRRSILAIERCKKCTKGTLRALDKLRLEEQPQISIPWAPEKLVGRELLNFCKLKNQNVELLLWISRVFGMWKSQFHPLDLHNLGTPHKI